MNEKQAVDAAKKNIQTKRNLKTVQKYALKMNLLFGIDHLKYARIEKNMNYSKYAS